jgi:hypothetical protein
MLFSHQFAILTTEEAKTLMDYIQNTTATASRNLNYEKMKKMGIWDIYVSLKELVDSSGHYEHFLRTLDPNE